MGSSTYVSDLKYRRQNELLENRVDLEASYGAALAEQLYNAWEKQLEYRMEVEKFNAQAQNDANQKALTAAGNLYQSYLSSLNRGTGSGSKKGETEEEQVDVEALEHLKKVRALQAGKKQLVMAGKLATKKPAGGSRYVTNSYLMG